MTISSLFTGRLGRRHFAFAWLAIVGIAIAIGILNAVLSSVNGNLGFIMSLVGFVALIIVTIVSFGISARRYHDFGWSGWYVLLSFIPFVNLVMLIVQLFRVGTPGTNMYGDTLSSSTPLVDAILNHNAVVTTTANPQNAPAEPVSAAPAEQAAPVTPPTSDVTPPTTSA